MRSHSVPVHRSLLAALSVIGFGACTFLSASDDVQCVTDQDCRDREGLDDGFQNAVCTTEGVCRVPTADTSGTGVVTGSTGAGGGDGGCESSEQCTIDNTGKPSICSPTTGECIPLTSEDCFEVLGDYTNPNAIIMGVMIPYNNGRDDLQASWFKCAVETAHEQIETTIGGLPNPGGSGSRPVALVFCDDNNDHIRTARHLVETVGVKAIVGPLDSEKSIDLIQNVTTEPEVLLVTQNASPALLGQPSQGLWWSVHPNAATLFKAFDVVVARLEAEIKAEDPSVEKIRLAVIHTENPTNEAVATFMLESGVPKYNDGLSPLENSVEDCDGRACYKRFVYPHEVAGVDWADIVGDLMEYEPHIIYQLGPGVGKFGEAILPLLEAETPPWRPRYLLDNRDFVVEAYVRGEFAPQVAPDPIDLASRITAVNFLESNTNSDVYNTFKLNVGTNCPDAINGDNLFGWMDMYYDATFLAVYSHVAGGNCHLPTSQLTGQLLTGGVSALTPAGHDDPESAITKKLIPGDIQSTVGALCGGAEVDLVGATHDLDFDPVYHVPFINVAVQCLSPGTSFPDTLAYRTAQSVDPSTGEAQGPFECPDE